MKNLQVFKNEQLGVVRTVVIDGEPWFVAKDVADILSYRDSFNMCRRLDKEDIGTRSVSTHRGVQEVTVINESGIYSAILGSKKPEAKKFKKWVTSEVLPAIRRHGLYAVDELLANSDLLVEAGKRLKAERVARLHAEQMIKLLEAVVEEQRPKVELWEKFCDTEGLTSIGSFAKIMQLKFDEKVLGRKDIFQYLRDNKVVNKRNVAYKRYVDRGLCVIKKSEIFYGTEVMIFETTLLTPKGVEWLLRKIEKDSFLWVA